MNKKQQAIEQAEAAFADFDKWETYGTVFDLMNRRQITLRQIKEIAYRQAGIDGGVIEMRRRDYIQMTRADWS
jgi:hypothetical protein